MNMLVYIVNAVFFGFALFNFCLVVARIIAKRHQLGKSFTDVADKIIVWNGIVLFVLFLIVELFILLLVIESNSKELGLKVGTNHSVFMIIRSLSLIFVSQLFRLKDSRNNNMFRLLLASLLLLVLKLGDINKIFSDFHQEMTPSGLSPLWNILYECVNEFFVFVGVFFTVYMLIQFGRKKNEF